MERRSAFAGIHPIGRSIGRIFAVASKFLLGAEVWPLLGATLSREGYLFSLFIASFHFSRCISGETHQVPLLGRDSRTINLNARILEGRETVAIYSYFLFGGRKQSPIQFDLERDDSAIALSICLLRDKPDLAQVWIIQGRDPVAVRIRCADRDIGMLVDLRIPTQPLTDVCV